MWIYLVLLILIPYLLRQAFKAPPPDHTSEDNVF
jgi:hypothetical protein